jgi:hypothetical protein
MNAMLPYPALHTNATYSQSVVIVPLAVTPRPRSKSSTHLRCQERSSGNAEPPPSPATATRTDRAPRNLSAVAVVAFVPGCKHRFLLRSERSAYSTRQTTDD